MRQICPVVNICNFFCLRFPADPVRREIWVRNLRRKNWLPTARARLCSEHFDDSTCYKTGSVKIMKQYSHMPKNIYSTFITSSLNLEN